MNADFYSFFPTFNMITAEFLPILGHRLKRSLLVHRRFVQKNWPKLTHLAVRSLQYLSYLFNIAWILIENTHNYTLFDVRTATVHSPLLLPPSFFMQLYCSLLSKYSSPDLFLKCSSLIMLSPLEGTYVVPWSHFTHILSYIQCNCKNSGEVM